MSSPALMAIVRKDAGQCTGSSLQQCSASDGVVALSDIDELRFHPRSACVAYVGTELRLSPQLLVKAFYARDEQKAHAEQTTTNPSN